MQHEQLRHLTHMHSLSCSKPPSSLLLLLCGQLVLPVVLLVEIGTGSNTQSGFLEPGEEIGHNSPPSQMQVW